jgi:hypothetical protein
MLDQNNAGFENKLLAKIKEEKINPKPHWQFLLRNNVIWLSGVLALIIGAAAVSVMIYLFKFNDWAIYEQTKKSFWEFFVLTLPYFWFIFLAFFVFVIYYNFKHTEKGYHYSTLLLLSASIVLSIFLGVVFYAAGVGAKLDSILGRRAPFYDQVFNRHINFWSQPAEGRLSGLVIIENKQGEFLLIDSRQKEWLVKVTKTKPYPKEFIVVGQPIRLLGEETDEQTFRADIILPVNAGRNFFHRLDGRGPMRPGRLPAGSNSFLPPEIMPPFPPQR